jgi:hypothetical protein
MGRSRRAFVKSAPTGLFPIMHAAICNDLVGAHPRLPDAVFAACSAAKTQL